MPAGGSVEPASAESVAGRRHFLDVADPAEMKGGLDEVSLPNFVGAARGALERSDATTGGHLLSLRHPHEALHARRDRAASSASPRAAYLDDTGHMSGVDSLLALDRAGRAAR